MKAMERLNLMKRMAAGISCYMLCAVLLMGCASKPDPVSLQGSSSASSSQEVLSAKSVLLPMENTAYKKAELNNFEDIGAQFWIADAVDNPLVISDAYLISRALYYYRDYNNALIFSYPFETPDEISSSVKIDIAASQAPHVDVYSSAFQRAKEHPLYLFVKEAEQNGKSIGMIAYADDVKKQAKLLFGSDYELPPQNGKSIFYDETLGIFYLETQAVNVYTDYPIVLSFETRGALIDAKVAIVCYSEVNGRWASKDGSWMSSSSDIEELRKYLGAYLADVPQYHYVLERSENEDDPIPATVISFSPLS